MPHHGRSFRGSSEMYKLQWPAESRLQAELPAPHCGLRPSVGGVGGVVGVQSQIEPDLGDPAETMRFPQPATIGLTLMLAGTAAANPPGHFKSVIFGVHTESLAGFEAFAARAKQSGATH